VHLLVCYWNKLQNARCNAKERKILFHQIFNINTEAVHRFKISRSARKIFARRPASQITVLDFLSYRTEQRPQVRLANRELSQTDDGQNEQLSLKHSHLLLAPRSDHMRVWRMRILCWICKLNWTVSIPLCTCNNFIKPNLLYTT